MSETMTPPVATVGRKCRIEEVFDPGFIELIRLVPLNPHVRALILKLTGKMPDLDCATFEQVKAWVETNCEKKARPSTNGRRRPDDGIGVRVDFAETEYGRAAYTVRCSGSAEFRLGASDLSELIQNAVEAGEGIDGIVDLVAEKIDEDAWSQCEPDLDSDGEYDYDDHDATGSENSETSYSKGDIRDAVLAFVRERHPELEL